MRPTDLMRVTTDHGGRAPHRHNHAPYVRGRRAGKIGGILYTGARLFLAAFLGLWMVAAVFAILHRPAYLAEQERLRVDALADENRTYCTRWGFSENTHAFNLCALDLDEIRARERDRAVAAEFPL